MVRRQLIARSANTPESEGTKHSSVGQLRVYELWRHRLGREYLMLTRRLPRKRNVQ